MPVSSPYPRIERVSESLLIVRVGAIIDLQVNHAAQVIAQRILRADLRGVNDVAPAYASVAVRYQPRLWMGPRHDAFAAISDALKPFLFDITTGAEPRRLVEIPVCYGGAHGVDLAAAAETLRMTVAECIALHVGADYRVAMLGFAPGFPYLLGLPPQLQLPRRAQPRLRVPAGSVAIGGAQTGIYPCELPGGWHLIGCTPLRLFDSAAPQPCLLAPGDGLRFRAITPAQFDVAQRALIA
ncbi:MAG: 5-oxoprolinase subunit PxpB [Pseudomonadota bacterium]|nr:5-oxoprolinase subunit PxpB [Pseudomonadota bacterium]